ncbi:MAG: hypothetical protein PHS17_20095 [Desulfobacterales bacterium]|nr:hypothetical protein [Desulfobacterales bacterium]
MICEKQVLRTNGMAYRLDFNVIARIADDMGIITDAVFWDTMVVCERTIIDHINGK